MPPKDRTIEPIAAPFDNVAKAMVEESPLSTAKKLVAKSKRNREEMARMDGQIEMELVKYDGQNIPIDLSFDWSHETVWATRQQIAILFDRDADTIGEHISNIYDAGELEREATTGFFPVVRREGARQVSRDLEHYNLDVILSVGYRVSSAKATEFRKWATQTLRRYITDGFAINEGRLRSDPHALQELAAKVRALRSEEINVYKAVRDVFAFASSDYSKDAPNIGLFFAKLQDKFTYAVTGQRSPEILLERANHLLQDMGLTSMTGSRPSHADIQKAKNYLDKDELYQLHLLCEQFLLFVETAALRGKKLTMQELSDKFDELLKLIGFPVFSEYRQALALKAKNHAIKELELYQERLKLERAAERMMGALEA